MAAKNPQMRPASRKQAPDPATSYERAKPDKEAGMGRLDNNQATPEQCPDRIDQAVKNKQPPRQLNAHEVLNEKARRSAAGRKIK